MLSSYSITHSLNSHTSTFIWFEYLDLCGCWHMPTALLPFARNVAGICRQPCWHMPAIMQTWFFKVLDWSSLIISAMCFSLLRILKKAFLHQNDKEIRYLYHFRRYCECFSKIISTFVAKYITQKS